jgi:hypothetical protein
LIVTNVSPKSLGVITPSSSTDNTLLSAEENNTSFDALKGSTLYSILCVSPSTNSKLVSDFIFVGFGASSTLTVTITGSTLVFNTDTVILAVPVESAVISLSRKLIIDVSEIS